MNDSKLEQGKTQGQVTYLRRRRNPDNIRRIMEMAVEKANQMDVDEPLLVLPSKEE